MLVMAVKNKPGSASTRGTPALSPARPAPATVRQAAPKAPWAAAGFGVMLKHSFGDGSPSLGCCIGGESPPLVSYSLFSFSFELGVPPRDARAAAVCGCVGVDVCVCVGVGVGGARLPGQGQRSSARRGWSNGEGEGGWAVGEGVEGRGGLGVRGSRHFPASQGRGCPGK